MKYITMGRRVILVLVAKGKPLEEGTALSQVECRGP